MARLQILELPEGADDDRPPFLLVIDQAVPQRAVLSGDTSWRDPWQDIADKIGARGAIVTPETVNIPANDTTAYLDAAVSGALPTDAHYETTVGGQPVTWTHVDEARARAVAAVQERTDIARDMDRLAKWRDELLDALGMDRTRGWDDIRNTAAGIRKQRDGQSAAIERVRQIHFKQLQDDRYEDTGLCASDADGWPCPTIQALGSDTERSPEE